MDGLEDIPHPITVPTINFHIPPSEIGRKLPNREVARETITDAYVQFVLFCNPAYPDDVDTTTLRETFNTPPTSNKKTFDTFDIYVLVKRMLEHDNIKTWQQLALELGVEPGTAEDGAGSQRVPQYIVRLKKWMKASHIDAFFQYLAGKAHEYYIDIPPVAEPHPPEGRDTILPTEDLALRSLDPRLRPKRGRKRLESTMDELPPAQRHTFQHVPDDRRALFGTPISAVPRSAYPSSAMIDRLHDPWSSISTQYPSALDLSATEPRSAFSAFAADPRLDSMPTPVIANRLNKWNAAAAASASSHSTAGTPMTPSMHPSLHLHQSPHLSQNRTMPSPSQARRAPPGVHPGMQPGTPPPTKASSTAAAAAATRAASGLGLSALDTNVVAPTANMSEQPNSAVSAASTSSRRERQRLQLQVPKHTGGPVRLMTPPAPAMRHETDGAREGAEDDEEVGLGAIDGTHLGAVDTVEDGRMSREGTGSKFSSIQGQEVQKAYEALKRSLASDLLRGEVKGRKIRLSGREARDLAGEMLKEIGLKSETDLRIEVIISAAVSLGLAHTIEFDHVVGVKLAFAPTNAVKKIEVNTYVVDGDGYEVPITEKPKVYEDDGDVVKAVFDVTWTIYTGGLQAEMRMRSLGLGDDSHV
ncbi:hypothetical protein B9Z65_7139 [Elsinoe australis]|uniref:ARS-binding protein 2 n=1 Tax=Elsinoe australis TaxID=40998 RepID=A0A2P7Z603_9PEZI|nr:hypothetical protein B9Z65_7139 [Elsinoe australis]